MVDWGSYLHCEVLQRFLPKHGMTRASHGEAVLPVPDWLDRTYPLTVVMKNENCAKGIERSAKNSTSHVYRRHF